MKLADTVVLTPEEQIKVLKKTPVKGKDLKKPQPSTKQKDQR